MKKLMAICAVGMMMLTLAGAAQARLLPSVLTFTLNEVGSDVVGTVSGTLNTNALTVEVINYTDDGGMYSGVGVLGVGAETALWRWSGFSSSVLSFGTGAFCNPTTGAGDTVVVNFSQKTVYISKDNASGSALSGTSTWNGMNFENLYITPGTYTTTYNGGLDSVVL
jgi:hypothetical protein